MDAGWIVAIALGFGFVTGALVVMAATHAASRGRRAMALAAEGIPDGVSDVVLALDSTGVVLDASNTVVLASPAAAALGVVFERELTSESMLELVNEVRETGEPVERELQVSRSRFSNADLRQLRARAAPIGNRFVLLLAEDHTDEVRLLEMRRDFVANVSHELKTPIGAIALLAEAIDAAVDEPERVRAFANRLEVESSRLARMTQELIDLSRVQTHDPLGDPHHVEIDTVIADAIDATRVAADAKRVRVTSRVVDHTEVVGDGPMLVMALQNLVRNAVQYSPEGGHVGIGARLVGEMVEISVTDKGVGISPEDATRVFERFYRVDPARSRVTGGTGLGLSITKHIAATHGGDVRLWSKPGQGSTFTMRLPVTQSTHSEHR